MVCLSINGWGFLKSMSTLLIREVASIFVYISDQMAWDRTGHPTVLCLSRIEKGHHLERRVTTFSNLLMGGTGFTRRMTIFRSCCQIAQRRLV